jgi:hypothetical protein
MEFISEKIELAFATKKIEIYDINMCNCSLEGTRDLSKQVEETAIQHNYRKACNSRRKEIERQEKAVIDNQDPHHDISFSFCDAKDWFLILKALVFVMEEYLHRGDLINDG